MKWCVSIYPLVKWNFYLLEIITSANRNYCYAILSIIIGQKSLPYLLIEFSSIFRSGDNGRLICNANAIFCNRTKFFLNTIIRIVRIKISTGDKFLSAFLIIYSGLRDLDYLQHTCFINTFIYNHVKRRKAREFIKNTLFFFSFKDSLLLQIICSLFETEVWKME